MPPLPQVPDVMPPMPQANQGLLDQFAASQGAQDFGLTASFDPETGQYITDLGELGFTGDKRFKRQTPAEFAAQLAPKPAPIPEPMPVMQAPALPKINIPDLNLTKINLPKPTLGGIRGIMKPRLQRMAGMGPAQMGARMR